MSDELVNERTDLSAFTLDQVVARMPEQYRPKLKQRIEELVKSGRKIRVYCDGVYDMFHSGHARMLEQVKKIIPNVELVVGVSSDEDVLREKGMCVMNEVERVEAVKACKWTDEVHFPCPWVPTIENLKKVNCDFTAHDCLPYVSAGSDDVYKEIKEAGLFIPTLRSEGISTSDIITRILRDRDEYFNRNLSRHLSSKELDMDWYECLRFGERPPNNCKVNKCINYVLDFYIIRKLNLTLLREGVVYALCKKKLLKQPEVIVKWQKKLKRE